MAINMNFSEVLNLVTTGSSDNKTSTKLGITRSMFSHYRNGRKLPSDDVIEKMANIAGLDPLEVYIAVYAERITNPSVAERFRHLAA